MFSVRTIVSGSRHLFSLHRPLVSYSQISEPLSLEMKFASIVSESSIKNLTVDCDYALD
jgi:hypothetical protein